jgi:hypothetical protein
VNHNGNTLLIQTSPISDWKQTSEAPCPIFPVCQGNKGVKNCLNYSLFYLEIFTKFMPCCGVAVEFIRVGVHEIINQIVLPDFRHHKILREVLLG